MSRHARTVDRTVLRSIILAGAAKEVGLAILVDERLLLLVNLQHLEKEKEKHQNQQTNENNEDHEGQL